MKAVCIQPHNDDCVIAIGGILQKLVRRGWDLSYVYVTDGRHGSHSVPPEELVDIRRAEAEEEMRLLGIHRFFELGVEDGSTARLRGRRLRVVEGQLASILHDSPPNVVFVPSRSEMHPDHRAAHDIVLRVIHSMEKGPLIVKYLVWLFPDFYHKRSDVADQVLMVGVDEEMTGKLSAVRLHRSQLAVAAYDSMAETVNAYFAHAFKGPDRIGSRFVEIVGIFGAQRWPEVVSWLLGDLEPRADITSMLHGRTSERIQA